MFIEGVTEPARLHFSNFMSILKYYYIGQLIKKKTYATKGKRKPIFVNINTIKLWLSLHLVLGGALCFILLIMGLIPSYLLKKKREKKKLEPEKYYISNTS